MKDWMQISQRLIMLGQLGLSLLMPLLMCLGGCYLLVTRVGLGLWIYFPGFLFGLGASFMTAYKLWLTVSAKEKKKSEKACSVRGNSDAGTTFSSNSTSALSGTENGAYCPISPTIAMSSGMATENVCSAT